MNLKIPWFVGYASMQSALSLEEVGELLSEKVFGGLKFSGRELEIHEEVPAIFIQEPIMGLKVVLEGYSGFDENVHFHLSVAPWITFDEFDEETIRLDHYLVELLKISLKELKDKIVVLDYQK
jgi:hypothetical protein